MASITRLPDGKYQARFRDRAGRQHARRFALKRTAQEWLDEQTSSLRRGEFIPPRSGRTTFRDYAERWRADQLHHRAGTAVHVESRLRLHVYPVIGDLRLGEVDRMDVQRVITRACATLAPSSVAVLYAFLTAVFTSAVADHEIVVSPCLRIRLPEVHKTKVLPLTVAQVDALHAAMPDRYKAMVAVGAATGLRLGELRGITVDRVTPALHILGDVPPQEAIIRIDRQMVDIRGRRPTWGPPKTPSADRRVPIGASTIKVLTEHLARYGPGPEGVIFTSRYGGPVSRSAAGEMWRSVADRLQMTDRAGWHELRHFHASLLIADGRSPRAVADRLGHSDPVETLRTYAHLWPDDDERSVAATEAALAHLSRTTLGRASAD